MREDQRDELLIRLDERSERTEKDINEIKRDVKAHQTRLDRLESPHMGAQFAPVPPPAATPDRASTWVAFMEFFAALPAFWHVALSLGLAFSGLLGFVWAAAMRHQGGGENGHEQSNPAMGNRAADSAAGIHPQGR